MKTTAISRLLILVAVCTAFMTAFSTAQEFVPNGNFETFTQCPWYTSEASNHSSLAGDQLGFCTGWMSANQATPDYYNSCNMNSCTPSAPPYRKQMSVPDNHYGSQDDLVDGHGYGGIVINSELNLGGINTWREYLQIELQNTPLQQGRFYTIRYYVSVAEGSAFRLKNWGAFLSDTRVNEPGTGDLYLNNGQRQFVEPNDLVLKYSLTNEGRDNWALVEGQVMAVTGQEKYLVIGYMGTNFADDKIAMTAPAQVCETQGSVTWSYNYIDGVSMTPGPCNPCALEITLTPFTPDPACPDMGSPQQCYTFNLRSLEGACPVYGVKLSTPDVIPAPSFTCRTGAGTTVLPLNDPGTSWSEFISWGKVIPGNQSPSALDPGSQMNVGTFCIFDFNRGTVRLDFRFYDIEGKEICRQRICMKKNAQGKYVPVTCRPEDLIPQYNPGNLGNLGKGNQPADPNPASASLSGYPNPAGTETTISYTLDSSSEIRLEVFNSVGERVAMLENGQRTKGSHSVVFVTDNLPAGTYFVQLQNGAQTVSIPLIVVH